MMKSAACLTTGLTLILLPLTSVLGAEATDPIPPLVTVDWTPPETTISQEFIDAIKVLLGNGLSDPRGGEFHEVTIRVGEAAGRGVEERKAFGWVMPGGKEVVAIDGLRYPVVSDKGRYSAKAFLAILGDRHHGPFSVEYPGHTAAALYLVVGDAKTAEAIIGKKSVSGEYFYIALFDRYKMQVAQCLMDREYAEALPWAKEMVRVSQLQQKSALHNNEARRRYYFEEPPLLLKDVIRRIEYPKPAVDLVAIAGLDQPERIAALMEALDEVAARQMSQPGGPNWMGDPILSAIVKENETAIPALLDTLENDLRFTRTISYHRDFGPGRDIQPVHEAAFRALVQTWPQAAIPLDDLPIAERAATLRALWEKTRNLTPAERWLEALRDDAGSPRQWLAAAKALTDKEKTDMYGWRVSLRAPSTGMMGESIRPQHGEEITSLIIKRAATIVPPPEPQGSNDVWDYQIRLKLVHCLAKWDSAAALPAQQKASLGAKVLLDQQKTHALANLDTDYALILTDRLQAGDRSAVADFVDLCRRIQPERSFEKSALRPLWKFPEDQEVQAIGEELFGRYRKVLVAEKKSKKQQRGTYNFNRSAHSALVLSPAFRKFLAELMSSETLIGTAQLVKSGDGIDLKLDGMNGGSSLPEGIDSSKLPKGPVDICVGDFAACQLERYKEAPMYCALWPQSIRRQARKELAAWLLDPTTDWVTLIKGQSISIDPFY